MTDHFEEMWKYYIDKDKNSSEKNYDELLRKAHEDYSKERALTSKFETKIQQKALLVEKVEFELKTAHEAARTFSASVQSFSGIPLVLLKSEIYLQKRRELAHTAVQDVAKITKKRDERIKALTKSIAKWHSSRRSANAAEHKVKELEGKAKAMSSEQRGLFDKTRIQDKKHRRQFREKQRKALAKVAEEDCAGSSKGKPDSPFLKLDEEELIDFSDFSDDGEWEAGDGW
jgi:hypothetical protein